MERNALKVRVDERAEDWRWGSLWARRHGNNEELKAIFSDWPVHLPRNWVSLVNKAMSKKEAEGVQVCIARNRPYGDEW